MIGTWDLMIPVGAISQLECCNSVAGVSRLAWCCEILKKLARGQVPTVPPPGSLVSRIFLGSDDREKFRTCQSYKLLMD